MDRQRILYGVDVLPSRRLETRLPHAQQSSAAELVLDRLRKTGCQAGPQSKSHSRTAVAAAIAETRQVRLGIDIEWMDKTRPFAAIASVFRTPLPQGLGPAQFYRGWTFYEAYYKAFQTYPDGTAIARVMADLVDGETLRVADEVYVMQRDVLNAFRLCLVWSGDAMPDCVEAVGAVPHTPAD